ncbi:MAG: cold-shock protein [Mangrovibacterium sp.]
MQKGKIKWYDEIKGFGFIVPEHGEDIFVHRSGLSNSTVRLQNDQEVVFETQQGAKGVVAVNVKPAV